MHTMRSFRKLVRFRYVNKFEISNLWGLAHARPGSFIIMIITLRHKNRTYTNSVHKCQISQIWRRPQVSRESFRYANARVLSREKKPRIKFVNLYPSKIK